VSLSEETHGTSFLRVRISVFLGLTRILITIAHVSESPIGELLRTDSARDQCQYGWMRKKKRQSKGQAKALIGGIKREMQEPRLAKSVREDPRYQVELAAPFGVKEV
jgi:hypothetical protein